MKLNKLLHVAIFSLALSGSFLFANEISISSEKTLNELIEIAIKNNVKIKIKESNIDAKDANILYSKAGYLPQLSLQGDVSANYLSKAIGENSGASVGVNANISQLLYDFEKTSSTIDASQSAYNASLSELKSTVDDTVFSVRKAYYDILNQDQLIIVLKEAVDIDALQLEQAKEYFKAGVRTRIDVTNAQLQLSNSKLELLKATYGLESAYTRLISILGVKLEQSFSIKKGDEDIVKLVEKIIPIDKKKETLVEVGFEQRAEVEVSKANIQLYKAQVKSLRANYLPMISLNAGYDDRYSNMDSIKGRQFSGGIYIEWDADFGRSKEAKVKEALAFLQSSKESLRDARLKIREEVTNALLEVKKSEDSAKLQLLSVELATQNLSLAKQRYKAGLSDMIELNDAKLGYTKSKSELVNSYYSYLVAIENLNYSTGDSGL